MSGKIDCKGCGTYVYPKDKRFVCCLCKYTYCVCCTEGLIRVPHQCVGPCIRDGGLNYEKPLEDDSEEEELAKQSCCCHSNILSVRANCTKDAQFAQHGIRQQHLVCTDCLDPADRFPVSEEELAVSLLEYSPFCSLGEARDSARLKKREIGKCRRARERGAAIRVPVGGNVWLSTHTEDERAQRKVLNRLDVLNKSNSEFAARELEDKPVDDKAAALLAEEIKRRQIYRERVVSHAQRFGVDVHHALTETMKRYVGQAQVSAPLKPWYSDEEIKAMVTPSPAALEEERERLRQNGGAILLEWKGGSPPVAKEELVSDRLPAPDSISAGFNKRVCDEAIYDTMRHDDIAIWCGRPSCIEGYSVPVKFKCVEPPPRPFSCKDMLVDFKGAFPPVAKEESPEREPFCVDVVGVKPDPEVCAKVEEHLRDTRDEVEKFYMPKSEGEYNLVVNKEAMALLQRMSKEVDPATLGAIVEPLLQGRFNEFFDFKKSEPLKPHLMFQGPATRGKMQGEFAEKVHTTEELEAMVGDIDQTLAHADAMDVVRSGALEIQEKLNQLKLAQESEYSLEYKNSLEFLKIAKSSNVMHEDTMAKQYVTSELRTDSLTFQYDESPSMEVEQAPKPKPTTTEELIAIRTKGMAKMEIWNRLSKTLEDISPGINTSDCLDDKDYFTFMYHEESGLASMVNSNPPSYIKQEVEEFKAKMEQWLAERHTEKLIEEDEKRMDDYPPLPPPEDEKQ